MARDHEMTAVEALRANVAVPFERARAMPPAVYTSEDFVQAELDHIFAREWFCIGRADALAEPGAYTTAELAGEPVLVVRGRDGALKAMSNVCRHRMSVLLEGRGQARAISDSMSAPERLPTCGTSGTTLRSSLGS